MMFFLSLDVKTDLGHLRLADRERTVASCHANPAASVNVREIQADEFAFSSPTNFEIALSCRNFARM